jgi:hypothetical protein
MTEPNSRVAALLARDPESLTEIELDELERAGHPRPGQSELPPDSEVEPAPREEVPRAPTGDSAAQLARVKARNRELLEGATPSPGGDASVGVGRTVSSKPTRTDAAPA